MNSLLELFHLISFRKRPANVLVSIISGLLFFFSALTIELKGQKLAFTENDGKFIVVLDAGHGGHDPGCLGSFSYEKQLTLEITLQLGELINRFHDDVEVVYTRKNDEEFVPLQDRASIANHANADLFISIHCNAHEKTSLIGTETYVMGLGKSKENLAVAVRENEVILNEEGYQKKYAGLDPHSPAIHIMLSNYQNAYQESSLQFASLVENQFSNHLKRESRGVKQAGFIVLAMTTMPSVLVEVGFLTNKEEERYLNSDLGKASIAASLYRAFRDYKKEVEVNN